MKTKIRVTFIFLLIAATAGLLLRLIQSGTPLYNYKYLVHTHSHIALLGWLYNASLIILQYTLFKESKGVFNKVFWLSQITFVGMLFSFPFEGYGLYSITFSTLYLFCSYYLVYLLFKKSKESLTYYAAKFTRWGGIYLVLSSIGPFALGFIMAKGLQDTFWYKLSIYWFLHFLYNGFFMFIVFAFLAKRINNVLRLKKIFSYMNLSVIPLYALSILWLEPNLLFYIIAIVASLLQLFAFVLLLKCKSMRLSWLNRISQKLLIFVVAAYALKIIFQVLASFKFSQTFLMDTSSYSIIGFVHLVMLGIFTLFFIAVFIEEKYIVETKFLISGIAILIAGIILSEFLLFSQSIMIYQFKSSIINYNDILFWVSLLMPIGIALLLVGVLKRDNSIQA